MDNLTLRNWDVVENIQHKHAPKPKGFCSWKKYWCEQSGSCWPDTCRFHGCGKEATGCGHVTTNYDEDDEYIIPLCQNHLSTDFDEPFFVNSGTLAVYIDRDDILEEILADMTKLSLGKLTLKNGMRVQNISGTHECLPRDHKSWKKYYTRDGDVAWPDTCRVSSCCNSAHGGAHVRVEGKRNCPCVYIMPMCQQHNTPHNTEWLHVKEGTILMRVEKEHTSGRAGTCYTRGKCR